MLLRAAGELIERGEGGRSLCTVGIARATKLREASFKGASGLVDRGAKCHGDGGVSKSALTKNSTAEVDEGARERAGHECAAAGTDGEQPRRDERTIGSSDRGWIHSKDFR